MMSKSFKILKNVFSSIRLRVLLTALLPLFICASALTGVTVYLRTQDSESHLQNFAETTISNLARSAEFSLYSGNIAMLRRATETPLKNEYVAGIIFFDGEGKRLLNNSNIPIPPNLLQNSQQIIENGFLRYYVKPIVVFDDDLMDQSSAAKVPAKRIGWVIVAITREPLTALHYQIILTSLIAFSVIFSLSLLLSNQIGRSISRPIYRISDAVSEMESGKLQKRVPVIGTRETRLLASTLNRLAERVENTNQELQDRIAQATEKLQQALLDLELRNSDLEDIRIDLEAALTAKDAFLARMSHELRTPLTSVIGFNRLLDGSPLSPQQRQYTRNIDQASVLLLSTIEDILDFSKLESGAMTLEEIDFDLIQNVEDLISLQACNVYNKDIELVLLFDSDVPSFIKGDPVRLKQVLNNLLSNAIKFTETGEIILRISLVYMTDANVMLSFMVKDSGIGIERENLRNLFQPFHQADNTISRRFGGTGLGLSICQQLIEQMGGDICIDSTAGVGTEVSFNLEFPLSPQRFEHESDVIPNISFSTLIIDSMPWSRRALRNHLSLWINNIYAVASPEQAIPLLQTQSDFGLIILSLRNSQLDETSANDILSMLRNVYKGPILILVGSVDFEGNEFQTIQQEFSPLYLLAKPAKRLQLQQAITSINALSRYHDSPVADRESSVLPLDGLKVLVVEDNPFNRQLLQSIITMQGGQPAEACNGAEALEIFSTQPFDALIIDMHMPVMDGIETIKRIRALPDNDIMIIGLTADLNTRNLELMRMAGADVVLSKPIDEKELLKSLCEKSGCLSDSTTIQSSGLLSTHSQFSKTSLITELQRLCDELDAQLQQTNAIASRETIHQILGLAGLFGMQDVQNQARDVSNQLKTNNWKLVHAAVTVLKHQLHEHLLKTS
jgi:two-component system sensor histidine kinase BarA